MTIIINHSELSEETARITDRLEQLSALSQALTTESQALIENSKTLRNICQQLCQEREELRA